MSVDLHCHTKMSDGSISIDELVLLAKRRGLSTIAVTDHDTLAGATRAKICGDRHGVQVIPGVEISCVDPDTGRKVHMLGYGCSSPDRLEGLCKRIGDSRRKAAGIMLQKVLRLYPISTELVMRRAQGSTNVFKQHIMHALMEAGCTGELYGPLYQKLFHPKTGFAYAPVEYPDVHDVAAQLREAGGAVVLAHPGEYDSYDLLEKLASLGELDGVEVWHPRNHEGDEVRFQEVAGKYGLIMTGGTDFHGMYSPRPIQLGEIQTPDDQLAALKKCITKRKA